MKNLKTVSFIIPAYNEEIAVKDTLLMIPVEELVEKGYKVEVVLVDNNSSDKTVSIAQKVFPDVIIAKQTKQGYGATYKKGFSVANGDIFVCGDCDGTYPFDDAPRLIAHLEKNKLDFITTNRFSGGFFKQRNMPVINRFGNFILSLTLRLLYRFKIKDCMSGMWIIRKDALKKTKIRFDTMAFSHEIKVEFIHFTKAHWDEVPIRYNARLGPSKLNLLGDGLISLRDLIQKRFYR